jgi:hypothetical protein
MSDWGAIRAEFPSLRGRTFLNTATFGQLPTRTKEAAMAHFERRDKQPRLIFSNGLTIWIKPALVWPG